MSRKVPKLDYGTVTVVECPKCKGRGYWTHGGKGIHRACACGWDEMKDMPSKNTRGRPKTVKVEIPPPPSLEEDMAGK